MMSCAVNGAARNLLVQRRRVVALGSQRERFQRFALRFEALRGARRDDRGGIQCE